MKAGVIRPIRRKLMDKRQQERQNRQKNLDKFNSITQKIIPENQNQEHNARKEAVDVKMRQV